MMEGLHRCAVGCLDQKQATDHRRAIKLQIFFAALKFKRRAIGFARRVL